MQETHADVKIRWKLQTQELSGGPEILQTGLESRGQADHYPEKACLAVSSFPVTCIGKTLVCLLCVCMCSVTQSCLTLCDPTDCSLPGSSVHGISKARIQAWVAIQGIFTTQGSHLHLLCLLHWQVDSLPLCHLGSPLLYLSTCDTRHVLLPPTPSNSATQTVS